MNARVRAALVLLIISFPPLFFTSVGVAKPLPSALFASVALLWILELLPLAVTALLVPCGAVVFNILTPTQAFSPFGDQILFLLLAVFMLVAAFQRSGLDQRIALTLLSFPIVSRSAEHLVLGLSLLCWLLGMWMSNTATCALMLPLVMSIIKITSKHRTADARRNLNVRLLLLCAFTPSIGGMATPIGSLPNMVAVRALQSSGKSISFLDWCLYALPLSIALLLISIFILRMLYPLRSIDLREASDEFARLAAKHGALSKDELLIFLCFISAVILWVLPGLLVRALPELESFRPIAERLSPGVVAILCTLPLFLCRSGTSERYILNAEDFSKVDWSAILLFGGSLALGEVLSTSGLARDIALLLPTPGTGVLLCALGISLAAVTLSEFSSNTASAAILVPIVMALTAQESPQLAGVFIAITVFACGLGFALPVSTPPNAMVYGTGHISLKEMMKAGLCLDLVALVIVPIVCLYLLPSDGPMAIQK